MNSIGFTASSLIAALLLFCTGASAATGFFRGAGPANPEVRLERPGPYLPYLAAINFQRDLLLPAKPLVHNAISLPVDQKVDAGSDEHPGRVFEATVAEVHDQVLAQSADDASAADGLSGFPVKIGILDLEETSSEEVKKLENLSTGFLPSSVLARTGITFFPADISARDINFWKKFWHGVLVSKVVLNLAPHAQLQLASTSLAAADHERKAAAVLVGTGARVVNISLGVHHKSWIATLDTDSTLVHTVTSIARSGGLVVLAGGNYRENMSSSYIERPAHTAFGGQMDNIIFVVALNRDGSDLASFSAYAGDSDFVQDSTIAAPGEGILLYGKEVDGTSFAAPMVVATAAHILERFPQLTARRVKSAILKSATKLEVADAKVKMGAGRLNMAEAITRAGIEADDYNSYVKTLRDAPLISPEDWQKEAFDVEPKDIESLINRVWPAGVDKVVWHKGIRFLFVAANERAAIYQAESDKGLYLKRFSLTPRQGDMLTRERDLDLLRAIWTFPAEKKAIDQFITPAQYPAKAPRFAAYRFVCSGGKCESIKERRVMSNNDLRGYLAFQMARKFDRL
jgi:hypothetical protein